MKPVSRFCGRAGFRGSPRVVPELGGYMRFGRGARSIAGDLISKVDVARIHSSISEDISIFTVSAKPQARLLQVTRRPR